ncbi:MAG TPA: helix-turn-helix transcriptional regulator [Thermoanaerobaculaceae bacterium]|nr:helix-turn-helix transcriptional regulator [Thermoanaerobaculaceae bacterium]
MAGRQDVFYVELGKRIKHVRQQKGLTQQALADAIMLTRTSITNIECGRQPVMTHHLVRIANTLGVEVHTLLPSPTLPPPEITAKLRTLGQDKREWVGRVLGSTSTD